jgi:acyl dehydratase
VTRSQQVYAEDVAPGYELPELVKNCSPRQLVMWAGAAPDFYEIHYDTEFARAAGLPGLVVHGALKYAFLGQLLHDWVAPDGHIASFRCSYRGLDSPGEDLRCRGVVRKVSVVSAETRIELEVWIENARGEITTPGGAVVILPSREVRRNA